MMTNELFEALNTNDAHLSDELINCDERLLWFLYQNTHMTKSEIKRQIADGVGVYQDNQVGYNEFRENCLAGLCDEDDVLDMWEALDIVGDYRFDWVL